MPFMSFTADTATHEISHIGMKIALYIEMSIDGAITDNGFPATTTFH